jgi:cell shape-determining protein MreD
MLAGVFLASANLLPKMTGTESFIELLSDWKVLVALLGINFAVYILGGFVIAMAFRIQAYSALLIAALISCLLEGLLPLIPVAIQNFALFVDVLTSGALWPAAFWLLFVAAALLGAKLANRASPQLMPTPLPA